MKKIFSKILIAILILGFLFAPVTPKIDTQNHFGLAKNETRAEKTFTKIKGQGSYTVTNSSDTSSSGSITGTTEGYPDGTYNGVFWIASIGDNASYTITIKDNKITSGTWTAPGKVTSGDTWVGNYYYNTPIIDTNGQAGNGIIPNSSLENTNTGSFFNCNIVNPVQCVVAVLYGVIWVPISWITQLSAQVLDFFIFYSLQGSSYETKFVESGWAIIRDISNLFFIVALLYVAGKTVLGLNASNNKKVITMVIMMALLINFSLFISKVVIDASNILARVFYNSIENVNQNNQTNVSGEEDEKQLTVGLVKTFNPQSLFIASGITNINNHTTVFVILLLISGALMVYMVITFLSIAFLFVGRVVGLWILMIFAPLAFASYTMPSFKIPKFGNQEWWSSLFNLSFTAPIFIFFLYLIISFGDAFKIVTYGENGDVFSTGVANGDVDQMRTYLSVIVPFALVYVLLKQAKETTTKMAGDIAQGVNTAGKALVGATVGLAAAGTAMAGRKIIGQTLAKASRGETLSQRTDYGNMNQLQIGLSKAGKFFNLHKAYGDTMNIKTKTIDSGLGGMVNKSQKSIKEVAHAKHEINDAKKAAGVEGIEDGRLSAVERATVLEKFTKSKKSEIEKDIKEGKVAGLDSQSEYETKNRNIVLEAIRTDAASLTNGNAKLNSSGVAELTDQGRKNAESKLDSDYNKNVIQANTEKVAKEKYEHFEKEAKQSISIKESVMSKSTSGSYDIRNFNPVADKKSSLMNKVALFYLASIASSLRSGLKSTDMNPGKGQGDILKDLSSTVTSALKGIKIDIKSGGGGGGGHDSHGGGHDDHGGGHGGGGHH